jgi:hypothetical protein
VGKTEGSTQLGRQRKRRKDNIKMDLGKMGWHTEFISLRKETMAGYCEHGNRIWSSTKRGDLPAFQKGLCAVETVYSVFLLTYTEPVTF